MLPILLPNGASRRKRFCTGATVATAAAVSGSAARRFREEYRELFANDARYSTIRLPLESLLHDICEQHMHISISSASHRGGGITTASDRSGGREQESAQKARDAERLLNVADAGSPEDALKAHVHLALGAPVGERAVIEDAAVEALLDAQRHEHRARQAQPFVEVDWLAALRARHCALCSVRTLLMRTRLLASGKL